MTLPADMPKLKEDDATLRVHQVRSAAQIREILEFAR
jgi:hypothetical protein